MLSQMLTASRKETVRLLSDYPSSYRSHENIYVEIEKQDPAAAGRMMLEHFALMEMRARQCNIMPVAAEGSE
jgi:DNA-binding FadR family transcriptional regulator